MRKGTGKKHKTKRFHFKKKFINSIEDRIIRKIVLLSKKDVADFLEGIPPLKRTDMLFSPSQDLHDSFLNRGTSLNEYHLPEAYMSTAFLLLTMMELTNTNSIRDGLIFPAFFSFRHYLELTMKDSLNRLKNRGLDELVILREHNLCKLWTQLSPFIEDGKEKEIIQNLLFEINRFDKDGELFRYPYEVGKDGEQLRNSLPSGLFEIKKLKMTMLKIYRFMSGISYLAYDSQY